MKNRLVTLFYGDAHARRAYRPLFDRWIQHHAALGLAERILVVTEDRGVAPPIVKGAQVEILALDVRGYADLMRPEHPFDMKGALLCELLTCTEQPFLYLDADAYLQTAGALDHRDLLRTASLAMPRDIGALGGPYGMHLHAPFEHVLKRCAGVMWCGPVGAAWRQRVVQLYRESWRLLRTGGVAGGVPWEPHLERLLEQHAWSHAAQLLEQPLLPDAWNWPAHIPAFRSDTREPARKHVHHHFGRKKWKELGRPAPTNV